MKHSKGKEVEIMQIKRLGTEALAVAGLTWALALGTLVAAVQHEIADNEITLAIEDQLVLDPGVDSNLVDVQTDAGVVTLLGTVDNILAMERAARVAETVKGVVAVVNRIELKSMDHKDSTIRKEVMNALQEDPATESWQLNASVNEGRVILTGTVESWAEKDLAGKVAKGVQGVRGLDNRIMVDYTMDRSDPEIQQEIVARLRWDALVDDGLIKVEVDQGKAILTGTVGSAAEKRRARLDAWVMGVTELETDGLEVKYWARDERLRKDKYVATSDDAIREAIEAALLQDPRVNSFDVSVMVQNGKATLTGNVNNLKAKRQAGQDARNTVGVWRVKNYIKVRGENGMPTDSSLAERVRNALERNPYVDADEVKVSAMSGTVYLVGEVDTVFERGQADDVVSGLYGVTQVKNNLIVDSGWLSYNPYVDDWRFYDYDWFSHSEERGTLYDWEIAEEIRDELWWSPFVDRDDVNVTVKNGVATLTGSVQSFSEYQAAAENAREGGAWSVVNELEVTPSPDYFSLW
jgi:osmotically-inducible protein OsmY